MSRTLFVRLSAAILVLVGSFAAYTQQGKQANNKLNKLAEDLYEIEGDGGNVAVYITNEGVILVDDKYEQDHDQIVARVKSVTPQPIKYILSTHKHCPFRMLAPHEAKSSRELMRSPQCLILIEFAATGCGCVYPNGQSFQKG